MAYINGQGVTIDVRTDNTGYMEYMPGDNISIEHGVISVITTDTAEEDGTKPITAGGVYVQIGNIDALLKTI